MIRKKAGGPMNCQGFSRDQGSSFPSREGVSQDRSMFSEGQSLEGNIDHFKGHSQYNEEMIFPGQRNDSDTQHGSPTRFFTVH